MRTPALVPTADGFELAGDSVTAETQIRDRATILTLSTVRELADGPRGSEVYSAVQNNEVGTNARAIAAAAFTASAVQRRAGFDLVQFVDFTRPDFAQIQLQFSVVAQDVLTNVTVEI